MLKKPVKKAKSVKHPLKATFKKALGKVNKDSVIKTVRRKNSKQKSTDYLTMINDVIDPETGLGLVDMGLIYGVKEVAKGSLEVKMTLTTMLCPAGPQMSAAVEQRLLLNPEINEVKIEMVWDPPWTPEKMSEGVRVMLLGSPKE